MIVVDPISVPSPGHLPNELAPLAQSELPESRPLPREFDFQQSTRASHSEQPVPLGGVPRALREAAEMSGLDPLSELYNEALRYAHEGHLRLARERLLMLLCMAPDDGEARLMLARVHVAGQKWSDALAALDEAANCGMDVPMSLRRAVEDHLQSERASGDEQRSARSAREQGEVKALRQEARRLRSENAQFVSRTADLEKEVRKWAWATAGVSGLAIVFILASLVFGGSRSDDAQSLRLAEATAPVETEVALDADVPVEAAPATPAMAPSTLAELGAAALDAAPGLEGSALELHITGDRATVKGEVATFQQRKIVERALGSVSGVGSVDATAVAVRSRTQGATHVVEKGQTLSHIAYAYYGDSMLTKPIEDANGVTSKNLRIGQSLQIPAVP